MLEFLAYHFMVGVVILYIIQHESSWTTPIYIRNWKARYLGYLGVVTLWPILYIEVVVLGYRSVEDYPCRIQCMVF